MALPGWVRGAPGPGAAVAVVVQPQVCIAARVQQRCSPPGARALPAALPAAAVTGRVHPLERAAVAAAMRGQPVDAFADTSDALMRGVMDMPLQRPPWREAYASLRLPRLDRTTRFFG